MTTDRPDVLATVALLGPSFPLRHRREISPSHVPDRPFQVLRNSPGSSSSNHRRAQRAAPRDLSVAEPDRNRRMIALVFSYEVREESEFERRSRPGRRLGTVLLRGAAATSATEPPRRRAAEPLPRHRRGGVGGGVPNTFAAANREEYMRRVDDSRFHLRARSFASAPSRTCGPTSACTYRTACWGCGSAPAGIRLPQPEVEGLTE